MSELNNFNQQNTEEKMKVSNFDEDRVYSNENTKFYINLDLMSEFEQLEKIEGRTYAEISSSKYNPYPVGRIPNYIPLNKAFDSYFSCSTEKDLEFNIFKNTVSRSIGDRGVIDKMLSSKSIVALANLEFAEWTTRIVGTSKLLVIAFATENFEEPVGILFHRNESHNKCVAVDSYPKLCGIIKNMCVARFDLDSNFHRNSKFIGQIMEYKSQRCIDSIARVAKLAGIDIPKEDIKYIRTYGRYKSLNRFYKVYDRNYKPVLYIYTTYYNVITVISDLSECSESECLMFDVYFPFLCSEELKPLVKNYILERIDHYKISESENNKYAGLYTSKGEYLCRMFIDDMDVGQFYLDE